MSIPTIGVREIQFRSRLEAQWASVFEQLMWNWEYEPFDMNGYIPDFIITFNNGKELLVEVKGMMNVWEKEEECENYIIKIRNSGWNNYFVVVGGNVDYECSDIHIGLFGDMSDYDVNLRLELHENDYDWCIIDRYEYDIGLSNNEKITDHSDRNKNTHKIFKKIWSNAKNSVQWKGKQNITNESFLTNEKINEKIKKLEETIEQLKIEIRFLKQDKHIKKEDIDITSFFKKK